VAERAVLYPGRQEAAMDAQWVAKDIFTIDHFLSQGECDDYVKRGEDKGFEEASVSTQRGMVMMKNVRNNDRVIMDDASLAGHLWQRVQPFVPLEFEKWHPVGLNERFRFYRYDIGQRFDWHQDGCFERPNGERSFSTFMVYSTPILKVAKRRFRLPVVRRWFGLVSRSSPRSARRSCSTIR
jgi:hypothetical protein